MNYAFFNDMLERHGCSVRDRSATFAGRILFSRHESEVLWRKDHFSKTLLMSSYHLTNKTIPSYIAELEAWNPGYIDSYPSAIGQVARYICENRLKPKLNVRLVITSSETLSELQRDQIETAFDCRVLDHYGCTEMAVSAYTRPDGRYFIEPLYSIVEFERAPLLNTASLICTGLLNTAMPLLRYRIGDMVSDPQSDADQPFLNQTFERVVGREDDLVITPDGRLIGRLDPAFKGLEGIKQSQIIQTDIASLEVLVVATEGADRDVISDGLTENILSRTSREMRITIRFVDSIPLGSSGKFKAVVSHVKRTA
jgi:phenylacetate-CoA ligase